MIMKTRFRSVPSGVLTAVMIGLAGCATNSPDSSQAPNPVGGAVEQPFRDLNMVHDQVPPILWRAVLSPYDRSGLDGCPALLAEIAALDVVLGADIDAKSPQENSGGEEIISDALQGVIGLPFRGIVRRLSGANDREDARLRAILAGMVRRGHLKGLAAERGCALPAPVNSAG